MFSGLLDALARHAETERDLQGIDIWDVACRHWLTDAENAFTDVATLLSAIQRERPFRVEDLLLQRAARLIDAMIGSEEPGMFQRLHYLLPRLDGQLYRPGNGPITEPVRQMLRTARGLIDELASLQLYAETNGDEIGGPAPEPCAELAA
ncbi:hypothetical protein C9E82_20325 [Paracoccus siganidrum]|uniref:Uncharacterized protein n=2 Tax=Paracoccus siganidrum TaxID=1276757 RepID=A0A419A6R5_9RHOB|nr:hypothetical protein D3P05_10675 [Paracoccus siganidrum]RMC29349.1 hypothetical protein C9E82_20325 [Paracoccus siganidrum]